MIMRVSRAASLRSAAAAALIGALGVAGPAGAGGFAVKEGSVSSQGASFAGATAGAGDITYIYQNPAALSRTTGETFTIGGGLSGIFPSADGSFEANGVGDVGNADPAQSAIVPSLYAGFRLNPQLTVGVSTTSPFGLSTEYDGSDPALAQVYAEQSSLRTIVVTPMAAYDPIDWLSLGAGVQVAYADVTFDNDLLEFEGDDVTFGYTLGALIDVTDSTTLGVAWRSGLDLKADGTATGPAVLQSTLGARDSTDASLSAEAPPVLSVGVRQGLTEDLDLLVEGQWQRWSDTDVAKIRGDGVSIDDTFGYEDAFFVAAGVEYQATEQLQLRTGVAWDETPTTDEDRSIRIPDEDRVWLSIGASYQLTPRMKIDAAYSYLRTLEDPEVELEPIPGVSPGGSAEFEAEVHILSIGGVVDF